MVGLSYFVFAYNDEGAGTEIENGIAFSSLVNEGEDLLISLCHRIKCL